MLRTVCSLTEQEMFKENKTLITDIERTGEGQEGHRASNKLFQGQHIV